MKLGLQLNGFDWDAGPKRLASTLAETAQAAEEAGFDRIAVVDHLWQHPILGGPEANEPECYATLSFVAVHTERVKLGAMVSGVHFRHPATCGGNGRGQLVMIRSVFRIGSLALCSCFSGKLCEETATSIR